MHSSTPTEITSGGAAAALYLYCGVGLLTVIAILTQVVGDSKTEGLLALAVLLPFIFVFGRAVWLRPRSLRVSPEGVLADSEVVPWESVSEVRFSLAVFPLPFRFALIDHRGGRLTTVVPWFLERGKAERAVVEAWSASGTGVETETAWGSVSRVSATVPGAG